MAETWKFPEAVERAKRDVASVSDWATVEQILTNVRAERGAIERCNWHDFGTTDREGYAAAYEHAAREQLQLLMARAEVGRG
jgi:hypothetical protein